MGLIYYNPTNLAEQITVAPDYIGNVPEGWVYSGGADGATPTESQTFQSGGASGGYPAYPDPMDGETFQEMLLRLNGTISAYGVGVRVPVGVGVVEARWDHADWDDGDWTL